MTRLLSLAKAIVCAAPGYLARKGTPEMPEDLLTHNCLTHEIPGVSKGWAFVGPDNQPHVVKVAGNFRTNSVTALLTAALNGQGLILTPTFMVEDALKSGSLVALLTAYTTPEIPIRLVYPPGRYLSAKVRSFIDFLVASLPGEASASSGDRPMY
jgi:DNA-binding transcriptional LysR family regulator